jgi:DNA-binding PadR family transcriptional regulator
VAHIDRAFHLLLALGDGPGYGYAIRKRVLDLSRGAVELEPGGLYRMMSGLERDGLIEPVEPPPGEEGGDSRRRYYSLTLAGRRVLTEEARRLTELAARPEVRALVGGG